MLAILKFVAKVLAVLNSEISKRQIGAGFAYGALLGLVPASGLLPVLLLLLGLVVNINLVMMVVAAAIFKLLSFAVDPLANSVGYALLAKTPALAGFWTALYNMPVVPYTRFNNTIVLGSFVIGLASLVPVYFAAVWLVEQYRTRWRETILRMKIVQVAKASRLYRFYLSYKGLSGD